MNLLLYICHVWISLRLAVAIVTPLEKSNSTFSATEWETCKDYPQLQCRESTVPRFYTATKVLQGKAEGHLVNLERRLKKGNPTRHVWLFQGGPCTSADVVAVTLAEQVAKALVNDFIIQIPYERCNPHTTVVPDYPEYPSNFTKYIQSQDIPLEAYNTKNVALDLIGSVEYEKRLAPNVSHYVHAISYGNQPLNQMLLMKPDIFKLILQDGPSPPLGYARSIYKTQGLNLGELGISFAEDCERSEHCRSLSYNRLIAFVNDLAEGKSTPCFDTFVEALDLTGPNESVFDTIASTVVYLYNNPVPVDIFRGVDVEPKTVFSNLIAWYQGNKIDPSLVTFDNRIMFWALTNHLAQCTPTSRKAFAKLLPSTFGPFLKFTNDFYSELQKPDTGLDATGSAILADYISFLESASPPWNAQNQLAAQANTLIRYPKESLTDREETVKVFAPFIKKNSPVITLPATGIKADVYVVNGAFDPNTPLHAARSTFQDIQVATGYHKKFIQFNHAGHAIFIGRWSTCTPLLYRGFFGQDHAALTAFHKCLADENSHPLDWGLSAFRNRTGVDVWEGLDRRI
ncbi:hypothetical protein MMC07_000458 [Pseudocyphellaria aurata]|nr:hypothetical protein [Pseudocyphellaria aurata]